MKRLVLLVFFSTVIGFAGSDIAIVALNPTLNSGLTCEEAIKEGVWDPNDKDGAVRKCKEGKNDNFTLKMRQKYKETIDELIAKTFSDQIKLVKSPSAKADYLLSCNLALFYDELKWKEGIIFKSDRSRAIYTMWLQCELRNNITNEIIGYPGGKGATKWKNENVIFTSPELVEKGVKFLKEKFPKALDIEKDIKHDINYQSAKLEYKYDDEDKKEANGKEKGTLSLSDIIKEVEWAKDRPQNLTEFTLSVKQGNFIENNTKEIKFTTYDYYQKNKKLEYKYQTYNCNKEGIQDKKFEIFILKRTSQLTKDESMIMVELKAPFECPEPYYTVTTSKKITTTVKPIEKYRGISKTLKSFEEDKDVYYIYIDSDKSKIEQYHIDKLSTRKIHKEAYALNMESCKYEVKSKDKLVKNLGGRNIFKSEDAGWGFEDDTKIYVKLPSSDKQLSFTWGSLKENGTYHANKKYKKEMPKIVKELMGKVNGMATLFRNETKNSKEIENFKRLYDYPGTPRDVQCGGKVAMESLLIPPLDGYSDPDIEYKIDIRLSTKNEIKVMKAFLNNEVGNPGDFILKALQQVGGEDGK